MCTLPAGITPLDSNIEFFGNPQSFGKVYWISEGKTRFFKELPLNIFDDLRDELASDTKALKGLRLMGITSEDDQLEQYNYCNRGRLSATPDITITGKMSKEYIECGKRGQCPGENKVCSPLCINESRITFREFECLKLIGHGLSYKKIMAEMGFRRETAVNSLVARLRDKLQCTTLVEIALKVRELELV